MLILLEFNELCPRFLQEFREQGLLPNFQRLYESSAIYTSDAGAEPPNLEPWIQWVSVHSGMECDQHGVFHLGDGHALQKKCLAEVLSDAGVRVGVFGSMNTNYRKLNGYFIPDPWDKQGAAQPAWLQPFYQTVARQVQESSGENGFGKADMLRFGWFMARHGLRPATALAGVRQLWDERRNPELEWRRATVLERLEYDLFRRLNRRLDVQFATFFCNSTAHFQHYYWRNMEPELFERPPAESQGELQQAIRYGYQSMDRLLGQFLSDYPDASLVLCTALSQQPWTETTKCTFRPRSFTELLEFIGVATDEVAVQPVMAEEFHLECQSAEAATAAADRLLALELAGEPVMRVEQEGASLFGGCAITDAAKDQGTLVDPTTGRQRPFADLFHIVHTMRSGRHHPDGVLWIKNGRHQVVEEKVPLVSVAPTVLRHFQVDVPAHMLGDVLSA